MLITYISLSQVQLRLQTVSRSTWYSATLFSIFIGNAYCCYKRRIGLISCLEFGKSTRKFIYLHRKYIYFVYFPFCLANDQSSDFSTNIFFLQGYKLQLVHNVRVLYQRREYPGRGVFTVPARHHLHGGLRLQVRLLGRHQ